MATFTASGTNLCYLTRSGDNWPPSAGIALSPSNFGVLKSWDINAYRVVVALMKWDTSSIPDNVNIISASITITPNDVSSADDRSLVGEYYAWSTPSTADWTATAPTSPIFSSPLSGISATSPKTIALTDFSGINKAGITSMRTHVSGAQPDGRNHCFAPGGSTPTVTLNVVLDIPPTANFHWEGVELTKNFTDTSTGADGTVVAWSWTFGDGGTSNARNPSHTYAAEGAYHVTLTVTDSNGLTNSVSADVYANAPPVANFTVSGTGRLAVFTNTSTDPTNDPLTYLWELGDGTTYTGASLSHLYATAGAKTVKLTVTDDSGAARTITKTVNVYNPVTQTFPITANVDDAHASRSGTQYPPTTSSAIANSIGDIWAARSAHDGTFDVSCGLLRFDTSAINDGAVISSVLLQIRSSAIENADSRSLALEWYTWSTPPSGTNYTPTPATSANTGVLLSSLGPSTTNADLREIALSSSSVNKAGYSGLRLHITGGQPLGKNEIKLVSSENIKSWAPPRLKLTYNIPITTSTTNYAPLANFEPTSIGLNAKFTDFSLDPDGTIVSRAWTFGDGGTSTATSPSHTYVAGGTYTVTLVVTDNKGLTGTKSIFVTVNPPPVADFSISGTELTRTFTDLSFDPNGTIVSRAWNFGDLGTSTATNPNHTYGAPGTYAVTLVVTDNQGSTATAQRSVTVTLPGTALAYLSKTITDVETTLTDFIDEAQVVIPVNELAYWPAAGEGLIDFEKVSWTDKTALNGSGNLIGVTRGLYGSLPAPHELNSRIAILSRHDGAILTKRKIPLLPANATLTLQELRRHTDLDAFVWVDVDTRREEARLNLDRGPLSSGNVSVTLDENGTPVTTNVAVIATKEVATLTINNPQTAPGTLTITLGGVQHSLGIAGGSKEVHQMIWKYAGSLEANITAVYYDASNVLHRDVISFAGASPTEVANKIRGTSFTGWVMSGSGLTIIAQGSAIGPRGGLGAGKSAGFYLDISTTYVTQSVLREGVNNLNATQVAEQIRNHSYPGWLNSGSGANLVFTAIEPGNKGTNSYSAGATGATSTSGMVTTTEGALDTPALVAASIRTAYGSNTYWTAGGSGSEVTFLALSGGAKIDAAFSPGSTGVLGRMKTLIQGSADIVGHLKDSQDSFHQRRLLGNILNTTVFNIESCVSGAGTTRGIVSVWGSYGTDPKKRLWRVTNLDLSDHPLGEIAYGVTAESVSGLTWDVHTDEVVITDRGETYYRDHTKHGRLINQAYHYGTLLPSLARNDLFLQDHSQPILPGEEIIIAAFLRYQNVPDLLPAKPLYVTLHHLDGAVTELGTLTENGISNTGIAGSSEWAEVYGAFTAPTTGAPVIALSIGSRDISSGAFVVQELVISIGTTAKRTYHYATSGSFRAAYDLRTPKSVPYITSLRNKRVALETLYEAPPGSSASIEYRASDDTSYSDWETDSTLVPDLPIVEVEGLLESDGLTTSEIPPGYPRAEYRTIFGASTEGVFLKADRTEFEGGVYFNNYEDWHPDTGVNVRPLRSGRTRRQKIHEPIGIVPTMSLIAVRPEAIRYIQERWGVEKFVAEIYGESLTLKLLAKPVFERGSRPREEGSQGYWVSSEVAAEVETAQAIPLP